MVRRLNSHGRVRGKQGTGKPPHFAGYSYEKPRSYNVLLILDESPTITPTNVRFITNTSLTVQ